MAEFISLLYPTRAAWIDTEMFTEELIRQLFSKYLMQIHPISTLYRSYRLHIGKIGVGLVSL